MSCCFLFKMQSLVELEQVAAVLPADLTDKYSTPQVLLPVTFASAIGTLVAAMLILFGQCFQSARKRRQEERNKKMRRLRYKVNRREVAKDDGLWGQDLAEGKMDSIGCKWHIFLSHVWGTAQDQMRIVKERLQTMVSDMNVFLDVDDLGEGKGAEYVDVSVLVRRKRFERATYSA